MEKKRQKVLIILGPTASGKSDLGVKLARKFNGEIISADSRQVYKKLNIGTGKITKREMHGIPHHLLDVVEPKKQFSVSDYKNLATKALQYTVVRNKLPIVVGGTGLYIDALTGNIAIPEVPPNPALRKKLEKKSLESLFKTLQKKDPVRAKVIDRYNKVRLIRALEIIESIGKVPTRQPARLTSCKFIYLGLKPKNLEERILKRLKKRLPGVIREAKKLVKLRSLSYKRMHELGLEYRYVALYLQNKISRRELEEKLFVEIRRYAKRQMTWFKRNTEIKWFTPSAVEGLSQKEYKQIESYARIALSKGL